MNKSTEQVQRERTRRFDFRVEVHRAADESGALRVAAEFATTLAKEGASARTIHRELVDARIPTDSAELVVEYVAEQWRTASTDATSQFMMGAAIFLVGLGLTAWSASTASNVAESGGSVRTFVYLGALLGGPAIALRALYTAADAAGFYVSLLRLRRVLGRTMFGDVVRGKLREYLLFAPAVVVGGGAIAVFHIDEFVAGVAAIVTLAATIGALVLFGRWRQRH